MLDLFAGGGGISKGFEQAGFDLQYLVENDKDAVSTLRMHHPLGSGAIVYDEDVEIFLQKVATGAPGYPKQGDVENVHGSPPCKGSSMANRSIKDQYKEQKRLEKNKENNEKSLLWLDCISLLRPSSGSFENVTGMLREENIEIPRKIMACLLKIGYHFSLNILNAKDFGVSQSRERLIIMTTTFASPLPTRPSKLLKPAPTVRDVLADLEDIEPVAGSGIVCLPDGRVVYDHKLEGTELNSENVHLSQCETDLAPTILCNRKIKHYKHPRALTILELKRLQGFPDDYLFCGSVPEHRKQIGNAVPPPLAKCIAECFLPLYK
jgi:DNA (cytosine-5)-methyltransferase 1